MTCYINFNVSYIQAEQRGLDSDAGNISFKTEEDDDYKAPKKKILRNQNINSDFVIQTHNRFSYWEKDISDDLDISVTVEIKTDDIKLDRNISDKKQIKIKKKTIRSLQVFQTRNAFSIFEKFTEHKIATILQGKAKIKPILSQKKKCKTCGFKRNCHLTSCKAQDKVCFSCSKPNHFPKSLNCKIRPKRNLQSSLKYGCVTLRQFLKRSGHRLTTRIIPYSELSEKIKVREKQTERKEAINKTTLNQIQDKISALESLILYHEKLGKCSYLTKISLVFYLVLNLKEIYVGNQSTISSGNERTHETSCTTEDNSELNLSETIKQFLEVSADSTLCLENFVVTEEDKLMKLLGRLEEKSCHHVENIENYLGKLRNSFDKNQYNQPIEVLRSTDPEKIDDILNLSSENDIRMENSAHDSLDSSYGILEKNLSLSEDEDDTELSVTVSSDSMDQNPSPIQQVDGNQDLTQKPEDVCTGSFKCESDMLFSIINIFRSFDVFWQKFTNHPLCMNAICKSGFRCLLMPV